MQSFEKYLAVSDIIDWENPEVQSKARELSQGQSDEVAIARRCFEWVRDDILHCVDHGKDGGRGPNP